MVIIPLSDEAFLIVVLIIAAIFYIGVHLLERFAPFSPKLSRWGMITLGWLLGTLAFTIVAENSLLFYLGTGWMLFSFIRTMMFIRYITGFSGDLYWEYPPRS